MLSFIEMLKSFLAFSSRNNNIFKEIKKSLYMSSQVKNNNIDFSSVLF